MTKLTINRYEHHRTCGEDRCCDFWDLTTTIEYNGNVYEYHGTNVYDDKTTHLLQFIKDVLDCDIEINESYSDEDDEND